MSAAAELPAERPRILVIDDEPDIRETLDMVLALAGYEVSTAASGISAIERMKTEHFDLVITDLRMPGLSGIDTVEALRKLDPGLAVIVVSGYASEDATARCLAQGALCVMNKPFQLDELLQVVKDALPPPPG
ncbi:sigma-54 dependent DNA-binding response regulator [Minicystis rosea]|nr:sigma-54 dependent DNA-binding response regulator [Minicystis rosea]